MFKALEYMTERQRWWASFLVGVILMALVVDLVLGGWLLATRPDAPVSGLA